jgi:iron complex outermembrane receptor protein
MPTNDANQQVRFQKGKQTFRNYSASAGLTYQFSETVAVKVNTSRGFRAPNISELTSNGIHEGSLRYEYGNFDLKPETSLQADLGLLYNSTHISAELSLYQNNIDHYIYTKKLLARDGNDSIPDAENPFPAYTYTQGKARLSGGEFSIDLHPHPLDWLHFENALSLVYANNRSERSDSSRYLPFTPAPRLQSEIRTNTRKWKKLSNVFFKIQSEHFWKQNRVLLANGTETPTASYTLWNAGFGFDVVRRKDIILCSFYFTVENLFNTAYQNHLSRLKYADENLLTGRTGVFNMGRNFSFKLLIPVVHKSKAKKD